MLTIQISVFLWWWWWDDFSPKQFIIFFCLPDNLVGDKLINRIYTYLQLNLKIRGAKKTKFHFASQSIIQTNCCIQSPPFFSLELNEMFVSILIYLYSDLQKNVFGINWFKLFYIFGTCTSNLHYIFCKHFCLFEKINISTHQQYQRIKIKCMPGIYFLSSLVSRCACVRELGWVPAYFWSCCL